jgi:hypothetical protein
LTAIDPAHATRVAASLRRDGCERHAARLLAVTMAGRGRRTAPHTAGPNAIAWVARIEPGDQNHACHPLLFPAPGWDRDLYSCSFASVTRLRRSFSTNAACAFTSPTS